MKLVDSNSHMMYDVLLYTTGNMLPKSLIISVQILNQYILYGCDIPGSVVSWAPIGFMNVLLFVKWF